MAVGLGQQRAEAARQRWAVLERDQNKVLWMPLAALDSIPPQRWAGVDSDPTGWRFEVLRAGWARWLDGIGLPVPPIRLAVGISGSLRIADGNHRLCTAREIGVPVPVMPVAEADTFPPLFGWRVGNDAAALPQLTAPELVTHMSAPSHDAAVEFRDQLVALASRRMQKTGEPFELAARGMFSSEGQGLAVKFDRSVTDPKIVVRDLVRGLQQLPHTVNDVLAFVLASQSPDDETRRHYAATALVTLKGARGALDNLVHALEGKR